MPTASSLGANRTGATRSSGSTRGALEIEVEPALEGEDLAKLLDSAEYGCFIGASLTATPTYEWRVNGEAVR